MSPYRGENLRQKKSKKYRKHKMGEKGKCGKRLYHTLRSAEEALALCKEKSKFDQSRHETRFYWCKKCCGYHLTSEEFKGGE